MKRIFTINLDRLLKYATRAIKSDATAWTIRKLQADLKTVRKEHEKGRSKEILDDFFQKYQLEGEA